MFSIHLTGNIAESRQMEFEQTYLLASREIPKSCIAYSFYKDEEDVEKYHFITYWSRGTDFENYENAAWYIMIQQAFETLGGELKRQLTEVATPLKIMGFA